MRAAARTLLLAALCALAATAALAPAARADFGLKGLDVTFTGPEGEPAMQAGSHPYEMTVNLEAETKVIPVGPGCTPEDPGQTECVVPDGSIRDLRIALPAGMVGDPYAVPRCPSITFLESAGLSGASCPIESVVGSTEVVIGQAEGEGENKPLPLYNLTPPPGSVLRLGFVVASVPISIEVSLRQSPPYNAVVSVTNVSEVETFYSAKTTIWGNPADPAHDAERGPCAGTAEADLCPVSGTPRPFLLMPRRCTGPLVTGFEAASWEEPGEVLSYEVESNDGAVPPNPLGTSGCAKLGFTPQISSQATTTSAESASGLDFAIDVNDEGLLNPAGLAQSDIRAAAVTLPAGMTLNPSAAEGLAACSATQIAAEGIAPVAGVGCPPAAKVGEVEVETPLLEGKLLRGQVYVASQDDNPFSSLIALYMVIRDPALGILIKLPGEVSPDPLSGRLVTTFGALAPYEVPQFPFSHFRFRFREGPRGPLITPPACGDYETAATFTPWAGGAPITTTASFSVLTGPGGTPCPPAGLGPFAPAFSAGSLDNAAGAFSPFQMRITRQDGEQDITRFSAVLPPGVLAKVAGVPICPPSAVALAKSKSAREELASPSCPPASAIGRTLAGAGVGGALTYVPGTLYLGGPLGDAALSVIAITPALAGPFDAGTVVVREALRLNPETGVAEADGSLSDPIPHILKGIPLHLRDLRVHVDRPGFTLNPTSCAELAANAAITGSGANPLDPGDDAAVSASDRYQAASCASLAFKPKLKISLKGGTRRSANTALRAELRPRSGDANLKGAVVVLPPSQFIDNAHISNPCTRAQFAARACPPASVLGFARAFSPLLDTPLEGPVYFRSNGGARDLPDVVAAFGGQFEFNLVIAVLRSNNERIRTKVLNAPDAPVSKVVLSLKGGRRSLLENSEDLCRKPQRANFQLSGQNGRLYKTRPLIATSCKKQAKKSKRTRAHSRTR